MLALVVIPSLLWFLLVGTGIGGGPTSSRFVLQSSAGREAAERFE